MAVKREQKNRVNASGTFDVIHYETDASQVLMADGTTAEAAISGHDHDSSYLKLSGGTLTGNLTGKYIIGTWLKTTNTSDLATAATKICVLDGEGWVYYRTPKQILSDIGAIPTTQKGAASGVASLDSSGKVPSDQLPEISSVKTYIATIGTTWTEDEDTGVKYQNVAISGVLSTHTAKVDHAYTGSGTSDDYAAFVEAENQYLSFITNGYAETYDGGVRFNIFGDAPTVEIPVVVEVA